jgi:glycosyltransferase involved in cell wall biosynthesis
VRRGIATFPPLREANPYRRLLYEELRERGFGAVVSPSTLRVGWLWRERFTIRFLHFHWPEEYWRHDRGPAELRQPLSYVRAGVFASRLVAARALGYRIVWTVHQVYPHERMAGRVDMVGAYLLARLSHLRLAHDLSTAEAARRDLGLGGRTVELVEHGSYIGVYPPGRSREPMRRELGIPADAFVFLCFGTVRAYKQLEVLAEAFGRLEASSRRAEVLLIAGEPSPGARDVVDAAARNDSRVRLLLERVEETRVAELFSASDVAVLPRTDGGTSGALILALSLGLPVVAARTPVAEALTRHGAAGWLYEPGDLESLRVALAQAAGAKDAVVAAKAEAALELARTLSWPRTGERMAMLFREFER